MWGMVGLGLEDGWRGGRGEGEGGGGKWGREDDRGCEVCWKMRSQEKGIWVDEGGN